MEEGASKTDSELADLVSSLNERLTTLEAKVTKLINKQEQSQTRLEEIQEFSENIVTLQERKLAEIEENTRDQKKLLGELRIQLQSLQNSRVNHKDVLVRHENQTRKLIELVNDISEKQNEYDMERMEMEDMKARRFSTFEAKGRRTRSEDLYDFDDRRSSSRGSGRNHHHRRTRSSIDKGRTRSCIDSNQRMSGSPRRQTNDF